MIDSRALVMHVVFNFNVGGLENGIVNLINRMDGERFRHMVVALTRCEPSFCERVRRDDVEFISLNKSPGHGIKLYPRLYRLFADARPAIVHTRNLAALEAVVPARAAGVPVRIHGEHGWDVWDPGGVRLRYKFMRRVYRPFVSHYVALSSQLESYLSKSVGVPGSRILRICNGVDTERFHPSAGNRGMLEGSPYNLSGLIVLGTVGRLQPVKDQINLVRAFALLMQRTPDLARQLRLMIIGEGPSRPQIEREIEHFGLGERVWLAGERSDIPDAIRAMDLFVLPSRAEGIANTILEAMATGLPVVATDVGGSGELIVHGQTGGLAPANNSEVLAALLERYVIDAELRAKHGLAGRARIEANFSIEHMVNSYQDLYLKQLDMAGVPGYTNAAKQAAH